MTLPCASCSTTKEPTRPHTGPYPDRSTGEWIARCTHCGGGQVVDAPAPALEQAAPASDNIIDAEFEDLPAKLDASEQALEDESKNAPAGAPIVKVPEDAHMLAIHQVETVHYADGSSATGTAPLPDHIPEGAPAVKARPPLAALTNVHESLKALAVEARLFSTPPGEPEPTKEAVDSVIAELEPTE